MIGFLYRLIVGHFHRCLHEWETIEVGKSTSWVGSVGKIFVLRCKKCGDIEQREIYPS